MLLDTLQQMQKYQDTIVIFTRDYNGNLSKVEHNLTDSFINNKKFYFYDNLLQEFKMKLTGNIL